MASNTITEEMELAMLEIARKHREQHIDKFNIQLEALKDKFPNVDSPLINSWLSYASNPGNLEQLFPHVQPGSPIPHYLLTSRNFATELAQVVSSFNERASDLARPHRRVTTRRSTTSAQAGGSGPTPDQPQSSARGGDNPPLNSTGVHNDASLESPINFNSESTFNFNNESTFGFDDLELDGHEDDPIEGFGNAQENVVLNPPNSSVNPDQDSVVPEEVNPSSSLNRSPDIDFPEVDAAASPLSSHLSAGQPTNNNSPDEADEHGATGTPEGDADQVQQGATAGTSPEAGLNVEYAGYEAHHIPNSNVFGAHHALEGKLLKFTDQQYACMVMNGQKFDLPNRIDRLRVDLCFRADGSGETADDFDWKKSRGVHNIKLGEIEIEVTKYLNAHWVKWVFKRDADVIIHYLSSGREKKASITENMMKEIEELNKTLALRKEELRKLQEDY